MNEAPSIARVDGIGVLFVGPADLQHDLTHRNPCSAEDFEACLSRVVAAARAVGNAAGILVRDPSELPHRLTQGFTHIAVQSDLALIRDAFRTIVQTNKDIPT